MIGPWVLALAFAVTFGCGGGGGSNSGGGSAVSGRVPYLLSSPTITYATSAWDNTKYDVTVTLQADGPTGVAFIGLWILDQSNDSDFDHLDLVNVPGTKQWKATSDAFLPLPSGTYYIDSIVLDDGDPFSVDPLRTGWYVVMPPLSTSNYFVDERELSGPFASRTITFYNYGVSAISITTFTLP
jgi:hypothetical protein